MLSALMFYFTEDIIFFFFKRNCLIIPIVVRSGSFRLQFYPDSFKTERLD